MAFSITARPATGAPEAPDGRFPERIPGQPGVLGRHEGLLVGAAAVVVFVGVWQYITWPSHRLMQELFLPGPIDIASAFSSYVAKGQIWNDIWVSGQELVLGFLLAIVVGLPLGMAMGWYRRLSFAFDPFVTFFNAIPRVSLTPLFIIWFGIGINSKLAVVFLGAVFAILINAGVGVRNLDPALIKAARSFGANDLQLFRTVVLPGCVPYILAGFRLGLAHALTGVVVAELIAAQAGVGLMMATAGATFQTSRVFVGLVIIAATGVLITYGFSQIEKRFQSWKPNPT
jgi:ABC-type nitrate/sulfonate/bicarbonate transport system permease component